VILNEPKEFDRNTPFYNHAKEELMEKVRPSQISKMQEYLDTGTARLRLVGEDPQQYSNANHEKMLRANKNYNAAVSDIFDQMCMTNPWLLYWMPTTKSAQAAYPKYGKDSIKALSHALKDAKEINRVGKLQEHAKHLEHIATKVNELLDKGYRTIHFVSHNPTTKISDGKTDIHIGLSPKSFFSSAKMKTLSGQNVLVNIPTEEVFTSPQANLTYGKVSSTKPLIIDGNIIEGIEFEFKNGKITEIKATKNQDLLEKYIEAHENANMLGEVALVTNSPIDKLGRLFYNTLLDENATCHLAFGDAFPDVIKGAMDIKDYEKQQEYLKSLGINHSAVHEDFMIGGPNVKVYAKNDKGEEILLIEDNKFQL